MPYAGIPWPPECSAGKDGTMNPEQSCQYCKDTGHELPNCLRLQKKKELKAAWAASWTLSSSNWNDLSLGVTRGGEIRRWGPKQLHLGWITVPCYKCYLIVLFWQNQNKNYAEGSFKLSFCNSTIVRDRITITPQFRVHDDPDQGRFLYKIYTP